MMSYANPDALVGTEWLAEHLDDPDLRLVDATTFLPNDPRGGRQEYEAGHIRGAVHFAIDEICDPDTDLPHMMPGRDAFARAVGALGVGDGDRVVVYDANGGHLAAARVWWMFRVYGHERVALLNGGRPRWLREGRPTESGAVEPEPRRFVGRDGGGLVWSRERVLANIDDGDRLVVDARSAGRFAGGDPEPRPSEHLGHIPKSVNLPFTELLDPENDFALRPADEIAAALDRAGIAPGRPVVASCGSGVTACVITLGLHLLGRGDTAVYDGSWAEWGNRNDTPVDV